MPTMPHRLAGWRVEAPVSGAVAPRGRPAAPAAGGVQPPVSVPIAHGAVPAATAAALPPDDPPGTRVRSHGFWTGPKPECSLEEPMANSSWLVLPSRGAPAARMFSTTVAV